MKAVATCRYVLHLTLQTLFYSNWKKNFSPSDVSNRKLSSIEDQGPTDRVSNWDHKAADELPAGVISRVVPINDVLDGVHITAREWANFLGK